MTSLGAVERENPLRRAWAEGQGMVGGWCEIPSPFAAEIMARCGFDWVCVDWQHGLADLETIAAMVHAISASGAVPLVRVPCNEPWVIQKALDVGAFGVIVPLVNSREDAAKAAAACRYAPSGTRSFSPIRSALLIGPEPEQSNRQVLCLVMIETRAGLDNADAICSTPGVDGVFVGPDDLSLSLGLPLGSNKTSDAIGRVLDAGRRHGVPIGRHCGSGRAARAAFDAGFLFAAVASDRAHLATAAKKELAALQRPDRPEMTSSEGVCQVVLS